MTYRAITCSMCIDAHMVACGVVQRLFHMSSSARAGSVSSGHAGAGCWLPAAAMDTKSAALPVFARWRCRLLCGLIGLANCFSLCPVVSLGHTNRVGWCILNPLRCYGSSGGLGGRLYFPRRPAAASCCVFALWQGTQSHCRLSMSSVPPLRWLMM